MKSEMELCDRTCTCTFGRLMSMSSTWSGGILSAARIRSETGSFFVIVGLRLFSGGWGFLQTKQFRIDE